jgi:hypothetical protein
MKKAVQCGHEATRILFTNYGTVKRTAQDRPFSLVITGVVKLPICPKNLFVITECSLQPSFTVFKNVTTHSAYSHNVWPLYLSYIHLVAIMKQTLYQSGK